MTPAALAAALGRTSERRRGEAPVPAEIEARIVQARRALSEGRWALPGSERAQNEGAVSRLLALLWRPDAAVRRRAALALAGGDGDRVYAPHYGHFANTLSRLLPGCPGDAPPDFTTRYDLVVQALQAMLGQSVADLRGMSNMHYSFLSGGLYLAVLATCRDAVESARRLRAAGVQAELCRLLCELTQNSVMRRLNPQDAQALALAAGGALAALPPDEIPALWRGLSHDARARRRAYLPALTQLCDERAASYLLHALPAQPLEVALPLIACLGRLGAMCALPTLQQTARSRHRLLRIEAQAAIAALERAAREHPERILLRPVSVAVDPSLHLLRPLPPLSEEEQAAQLLRPR